MKAVHEEDEGERDTHTQSHTVTQTQAHTQTNVPTHPLSTRPFLHLHVHLVI